jgi:alcohol dehydrogenase
MKAAQITEYGDTTVIRLNDIEKPAATEGYVVIEAYASSINPIDSVLRSGAYHSMMPLSFPATLGGDVAGIVTEVGAGVSNVKVGDSVYGQANAAFGNSGAFAEYVSTAAGMIAKSPANVSHAEAATLPLAGASALQAIDTLRLSKGQKILITGGAGGIGQVAIQIAKSLGAHVTTTAAGKGIEIVKRLGADTILDYKNESLSTLPNDFDAVLSNVASELDDALSHLKSGGVAVSMVGQIDEELVKTLGVTASSQMTNVNTEILARLRDLVESGVVKPSVGATFDLDHAAEAFLAKESGQTVGKVAITIK